VAKCAAWKLHEITGLFPIARGDHPMANSPRGAKNGSPRQVNQHDLSLSIGLYWFGCTSGGMDEHEGLSMNLFAACGVC
jgi:hypothetical protein